MSETSWLQIDLSALADNLAAFRRLLPPSGRICAVVKANAYGLGALAVARKLVGAGTEMLGVYCPQQAAELVTAGIHTDLLVMMPVIDLKRTDPLYRLAVEGRLHLTLHSHSQARNIEAIGRRFGCRIPVHLELDSGMSRCGMSMHEAQRFLADLSSYRHLQLAAIFTHPAAADNDPQYTDHQHAQLMQLVEGFKPGDQPHPMIHFANTHAALRDPRYHHDMVRIGLGLYGYGDGTMHAAGEHVDDLPRLRPVLRWMSRIVHVLDVPAHTSVGYNRTYTTGAPARLGLVPLGYADGYPVHLSNRSVVRVGSTLASAPIRGKVNMDQLIVDLTDMPDAAVGSEVEVYSNDPDAPNALPALADAAQTSVYELLCRLSSRLTRKYVLSK
jgi:alanine racemase